MVSSFRLEYKLAMLQGFKGMHLYMLSKLYHLAKHECVYIKSIKELFQDVILD
jgi:hypothetical protein